MANATLGGYAFQIDPHRVAWSFDIKASEQKTIGGRVIQIYGTDLGDMTIEVAFGNGDRKKGDTAGWEAANRFRDKIESFVERAANTSEAPPLKFAMPSKGWSFNVFIKALSPMREDNENFNPKYTLTLFIVEDLTGKVVRGIKDKYIERLMEGIGWEQSEFNGPTADEAEALLAASGSGANYYRDQFVKQFAESLGGASGSAIGGAIGGAPTGIEGLDAYLWALRMQESGGNYTVVNSIGAAGAYQYMPGTWNNYKGYRSAHLAPPSVQDERAATDAKAAFDKYGSWEAHASIHYSGQYWPANSPVWDKPQSGGPTIRQYVNSVIGKMAEYPGPGMGTN